MTRVHTGPTERPSMPEAAPRRGVASRFWRGGTQTRVHHAARPKPNLLATLREWHKRCLLYTSPSPRDKRQSRMPSSA